MWAATFIYNMLFQFSRLINSTAAKLQDLIQSGVKKHDAWNQCTVQLAQAAKVSKIYLLIWCLSLWYNMQQKQHNWLKVSVLFIVFCQHLRDTTKTRAPLWSALWKICSKKRFLIWRICHMNRPGRKRLERIEMKGRKTPNIHNYAAATSRIRPPISCKKNPPSLLMLIFL